MIYCIIFQSRLKIQHNIQRFVQHSITTYFVELASSRCSWISSCTATVLSSKNSFIVDRNRRLQYDFNSQAKTDCIYIGRQLLSFQTAP